MFFAHIASPVFSTAFELTLWTRRAAFVASKFPCLTIDGNADSHGTTAEGRIYCFSHAQKIFFLNVLLKFDRLFIAYGVILKHLDVDKITLGSK
jgi:hypothetical protein